ncbi:unnamed protein product [Calypogeia fissa]
MTTSQTEDGSMRMMIRSGPSLEARQPVKLVPRSIQEYPVLQLIAVISLLRTPCQDNPTIQGMTATNSEWVLLPSILALSFHLASMKTKCSFFPCNHHELHKLVNVSPGDTFTPSLVDLLHNRV